MAVKMTHRMRELLDNAPAEWDRLPASVGPSNQTLVGLEQRGLIETAMKPTIGPARWAWMWRRKPKS